MSLFFSSLLLKAAAINNDAVAAIIIFLLVSSMLTKFSNFLPKGQESFPTFPSVCKHKYCLRDRIPVKFYSSCKRSINDHFASIGEVVTEKLQKENSNSNDIFINYLLYSSDISIFLLL